VAFNFFRFLIVGFSNLGRAFEEAAENINYEVLSDFIDTSYFEIYTKDRTRFFDALTALFDK
jgi:peptidyl-tRNA hydrolase